MKKIKIIEFNKPFLKLLPLFLVILAMVILMCKSYASLKSNYDKNLYIVETGGLEVTFQDKEKKDTLVLNSDALELDFKIRNKSDNDVVYNIYLQVADEYKDLVRYEVYLDDIKKSSSNILIDDSIVKKETLGPNEILNYKIKAWIVDTNALDVPAQIVVRGVDIS